MGNYRVAKGFLSFLTGIGFAIVALATVGILFAWMEGLEFFISLLYGLGIVLVGLFYVAVAQIGMALVATAESSAAIYSLLAKKEGLDALFPKKEELNTSKPDLDPRIEMVEAGKFRVGDQTFGTLYSAQAFLRRES